MSARVWTERRPDGWWVVALRAGNVLGTPIDGPYENDVRLQTALEEQERLEAASEPTTPTQDEPSASTLPAETREAISEWRVMRGSLKPLSQFFASLEVARSLFAYGRPHEDFWSAYEPKATLEICETEWEPWRDDPNMVAAEARGYERGQTWARERFENLEEQLAHALRAREELTKALAESSSTIVALGKTLQEEREDWADVHELARQALSVGLAECERLRAESRSLTDEWARMAETAEARQERDHWRTRAEALELSAGALIASLPKCVSPQLYSDLDRLLGNTDDAKGAEHEK